MSDVRSNPSFDVLDEIRAACRAVAERAQFVRVDRGRISEVAQSLALDGAPHPVYDRAHHFRGEEAASRSGDQRDRRNRKHRDMLSIIRVKMCGVMAL